MFHSRSGKTVDSAAYRRRWIGALALAAVLTAAGVYVAVERSATKVQPMITREAALGIPEEDARRAYRDLSIYDVAIESDGPNWRVDYNLKNPHMEGGGPHYLISGVDGRILDRKYEQ